LIVREIANAALLATGAAYHIASLAGSCCGVLLALTTWVTPTSRLCRRKNKSSLVRCLLEVTTSDYFDY
jgi:hypothetical protein